MSALIILIGISRIYLGQHWASDVLGAYLLGSLTLVAIIQLYRWGKTRFFVRQPVAAAGAMPSRLERFGLLSVSPKWWRSKLPGRWMRLGSFDYRMIKELHAVPQLAWSFIQLPVKLNLEVRDEE
jgi:hypothetical protein